MSARNSRFQQWTALLTNRTKRTRAGEFIVQGVRPITLALDEGWPLSAVLHAPSDGLSTAAAQLVGRIDPGVERVEVAPELMAELGGKDEQAPELLLLARQRADDLDRIGGGADALVLAVDRPTSPGNLGTLIRSADAFGFAGVIVTGHAVDPYDPRTVRASTGSLFAIPVVRVPAPDAVLAWVAKQRSAGTPMRIVGTDETGSADVYAADLREPTLVVVGNETRGMSRAWRDSCDTVVRIPITGAASSLNAAAAGTIIMYEAVRQRRTITNRE